MVRGKRCVEKTEGGRQEARIYTKKDRPKKAGLFVYAYVMNYQIAFPVRTTSSYLL